MVYVDSSLAAECNPTPVANEEGIFNSSGADPHPLDKSFEFVVGSNRKTAGVRQTNSE
jgi:hypothetical protein